jgi:hypothetical protein
MGTSIVCLAVDSLGTRGLKKKKGNGFVSESLPF